MDHVSWGVPQDFVNPAAIAQDPAFTSGLPANPIFLAALDLRYPRGQVGGVVVSGADQAGIGGTDTAITGMTITFDAVAGRRYRLMWSFGVLQSAVAGTYVCSWRLAGVVQSTIARESLAASFLHTCTGIQDLGVLGAGSKTVALSILTSSGTMTIPNFTSINGRMYIDDVGV